MRHVARGFTLCGGTALALIGAQAGSAQTGAAAARTDQAGSAADAQDPSAIVVTARRVEERLQDVPISITVFSQQQLTNRNVVQPGDLATYTPSLSINTRFGSEKATFAIRGFNQDAGTQPSVGIYFADVVAPRASGSVASGNGATAGSLFDLQNVQVLKGPQGTLFGRNTTGGAILLVPQKPTSRLEGYLEGSYGDYDLIRAQGVLNVPLGSSARLRVGFDRMKRDGYLRNRSGVGPDDFADVDYLAARASLVVDLTPDVENYTIATYSDSHTRGNLPKVVFCARSNAGLTGNQLIFAPLGCNQIDRAAARGDGYYDVDNGVPDPYVRLNEWRVINTTTWRASDLLMVRNIASYAEFRERTRINITGDDLFTTVAAAFTAPGLPIHFASLAPGPSGDTSHQSTTTEELQLQGRTANGRLVYQLGGYLERSSPLTRSTQTTDTFMNCVDASVFRCISPSVPATRGRVSLTDLTFDFKDYGVYAQATYELTGRLSATGGIRYTHDTVAGTAQNAYELYATPNNPTFFCTKTFSAPGVNLALSSLGARTACYERLAQKSGRPTWLADLDYKPVQDVLLYAKYARGYRQGSVNLLTTGVQFETVGPEKVDLYELGLKTSFHGVLSGTFDVTGFWNDFTDQQIVASLVAKPGQGVGGVVPINAGRSRIRGVEVESSVNVARFLRLDASYAYLDARILSVTVPTLGPTDIYSAIIPSAAAGQRIPYSPKHKLSATSTFTLPVDQALGRVQVAATWTHTGRQYATHADDPYVGLIGYNPGHLQATDLFNLNLNWSDVARLPVDLSLFVTNVTDRKYSVGITNAVSSVGFETNIPGAPRMFGARLRYRFSR